MPERRPAGERNPPGDGGLTAASRAGAHIPPQWARLDADDPERIGEFALLGKRRPGGRAVAVYFGASTAQNLPAGYPQQVVIKVYSKTEVLTKPGFERDLDIASRIQSPYLARTLGVIEADSAIAVVREYVPGRPLDEILDAYPGGLPWPLLLKLADGVLEGLATLHAKNVVHGGVWPGNIIVGEFPVLVDVALVEPLPRAPDFPDSAIVRRYQSPEQRAGRIVAAASDVYSWAMTVLAAAQGLLFGPDTGPEYVKPEMSGVNRRILPVLEAAVGPDPARRPESARLLRQVRKIRRPRWDVSISGLFPEAFSLADESEYDPLARSRLLSFAWMRHERTLLGSILRAPGGLGTKMRRLLIGLGSSNARFAALAGGMAVLSVPLAVAIHLLWGVWR